jgi:hypothetical protein
MPTDGTMPLNTLISKDNMNEKQTVVIEETP